MITISRLLAYSALIVSLVFVITITSHAAAVTPAAGAALVIGGAL